MSEFSRHEKSVVMLTFDRQIDRRILLEADSLESAGWKVVIVAMPLDQPASNEDPRIIRLNSGQAEAVRENLVLQVYAWIRRYVPMNGLLMRSLKRFAWRYFVDQESFFTKLYADTALSYSAAVFVAHDLPMLPVAQLAADRCGAKLVYDSHELYAGQELSKREKRRWSEIEARYIRSCDAVITVNRSIASELERRYGIDGVEVILNAEKTAKLPEKTRLFHEKFGLPEQSRILLLQGGLSAGRNLETLVEAMRLLKNDEICLVMLGDGALKKSLQKRASSAKLSERVFFHPAVPQAELLFYTAAADAGVIPYQATCMNNYFCTPNKLFEFIAAGLPILASDLPEMRSLVQQQGIGRVGDMQTAEKIASLVDGFFADTEKLHTWQKNVLEARKHICWENEGKKLVKIYEALL